MDGPESADAILVGSVDDLPSGQARVVVGTDPPIAIFNVDGEFFATDDTCTHAKSSLAEEGYVDGDIVECGYHLARFCVRDGRPLTPPARSALQTYAVSHVDGKIYVHGTRVPGSGKPPAEDSRDGNTSVTSAVDAGAEGLGHLDGRLH